MHLHFNFRAVAKKAHCARMVRCDVLEIVYTRGYYWVASSSQKAGKYTVACVCGNTMRVRKHHFGRMCRCTQCKTPIYVSYENVTPKVAAVDRKSLRCFTEDTVPMRLERGIF